MSEERITKNPMGYEAMRLAEAVDKEFDVNLRICISREQLLGLIGDKNGVY